METVIRVFLIYLFVMATLRLLGKRELSELSAFELVLIMLIPEISSQALVGVDFSITNAIIGLSTLLSLVFITSVLTYRFNGIRNLVEGKPVLLAREGRLINEALDKERVPVEEIAARMREMGIESFDQVKWVVLESDGALTLVPFRPGRASAPEERRRSA